MADGWSNNWEDYEVVSQTPLGKGKKAEVFRGRTPSYPKDVALKVIRKANLKKSEESFIFNDKGDSLGKIQVTESFPGKFHFKRTDWPNKNINFILDPGSYEIRLSGKQLGTVILKGSLKKLDDDRKYEFEVSEAWKLGKDEKRTSIPIEILNP